MAISQFRSKRKVSGGRYRLGSKKLRNKGNLPNLTHIGKLRRKITRGIGAHFKEHVLSTDAVNLYDPKSKKYIQAKIESVIESPSNPNYVRRNIMTKGSIIKTDKGNARIVSRPGQEGSISAVLLK